MSTTSEIASLQSTLFTTQRDLDQCLEASKSLQAREWQLQARISELERENARLRAALEEIARADVGGLQAISEAHLFDPTHYIPADAYDRLQAWRDEEVQYLMGRISARQAIARAALAGSGEK